MIELLLILLGLASPTTPSTISAAGSSTPGTEISTPPVNPNPGDTGGETQPIPPKR